MLSDDAPAAQIATSAVLGVALTLLAVATGGTWEPLLVHAANNAGPRPL